MNRKQVLGVSCLIGIGPIILFIGWIDMENQTGLYENEEVVFHAILADPALYDESGHYDETVFLEKGIYEFRFVPNGDSPQKLWVWLKPAGEKLGMFSQKYVLVGNLVEGGMSSWYTWEYQTDPYDDQFVDKRVCESCVRIDEPEQVTIEIDPRGDLNGPVSIELVQIK